VLELEEETELDEEELELEDEELEVLLLEDELEELKLLHGPR
jgi:hypothetical protein